MSTQQERADGLLAEQFGILEFQFRLAVIGGALSYQQASVGLRLGSSYISLPSWMSPQVAAREESVGAPNRTHVLVNLTFPLVGFLLSYEGDIEIEEIIL